MHFINNVESQQKTTLKCIDPTFISTPKSYKSLKIPYVEFFLTCTENWAYAWSRQYTNNYELMQAIPNWRANIFFVYNISIGKQNSKNQILSLSKTISAYLCIIHSPFYFPKYLIKYHPMYIHFGIFVALVLFE